MQTLDDIPVDIKDFIYWMNDKYSNYDLDDDTDVIDAVDLMATWDNTIDGGQFWTKIHTNLYNGEDIDWDIIRDGKEYPLCFPKEELPPFEARHIDSMRNFINGNT